MYRLLYVSVPNPPDDGDQVAEIVRVALARNSVSGVTSFLYLDRAVFLQALEGPRDDVQAIWTSIRRDPRHRGVTLLASRPVDRRLFGGTPLGLFDGEAEARTVDEDLGADFYARAPKIDPADIERFLRTLALDPRTALPTP